MSSYIELSQTNGYPMVVRPEGAAIGMMVAYTERLSTYLLSKAVDAVCPKLFTPPAAADPMSTEQERLVFKLINDAEEPDVTPQLVIAALLYRFARAESYELWGQMRPSIRDNASIVGPLTQLLGQQRGADFSFAILDTLDYSVLESFDFQDRMLNARSPCIVKYHRDKEDPDFVMRVVEFAYPGCTSRTMPEARIVLDHVSSAVLEDPRFVDFLVDKCPACAVRELPEWCWLDKPPVLQEIVLRLLRDQDSAHLFPASKLGTIQVAIAVAEAVLPKKMPNGDVRVHGRYDMGMWTRYQESAPQLFTDGEAMRRLAEVTAGWSALFAGQPLADDPEFIGHTVKCLADAFPSEHTLTVLESQPQLESDQAFLVAISQIHSYMRSKHDVIFATEASFASVVAASEGAARLSAVFWEQDVGGRPPPTKEEIVEALSDLSSRPVVQLALIWLAQRHMKPEFMNDTEFVFKCMLTCPNSPVHVAQRLASHEVAVELFLDPARLLQLASAATEPANCVVRRVEKFVNAVAHQQHKSGLIDRWLEIGHDPRFAALCAMDKVLLPFTAETPMHYKSIPDTLKNAPGSDIVFSFGCLITPSFLHCQQTVQEQIFALTLDTEEVDCQQAVQELRSNAYADFVSHLDDAAGFIMRLYALNKREACEYSVRLSELLPESEAFEKEVQARVNTACDEIFNAVLKPLVDFIEAATDHGDWREQQYENPCGSDDAQAKRGTKRPLEGDLKSIQTCHTSVADSPSTASPPASPASPPSPPSPASPPSSPASPSS